MGETVPTNLAWRAAEDKGGVRTDSAVARWDSNNEGQTAARGILEAPALIRSVFGSLHQAARNGNAETATRLLVHGADDWSVNSWDDMPLDIMTKHKPAGWNGEQVLKQEPGPEFFRYQLERTGEELPQS